MGYTKLTYDAYVENVGYWYGDLGVDLPSWAAELSGKGYTSVSAIDFYDDIFGEDLEPQRIPEDYRSGEYGGIAIELVPKGFDAAGQQIYRGKRYTITQGQTELYDLIDRSDNFCMISALSYIGKKRTNANARFLHALVIEIDDIKPKNGLDELIYSWKRPFQPLPQPTYIVCSGSGLHLYFVFERPIPMFPYIFEQFSNAKTHLTRFFWSSYVTSAHERVQYESVNQPFRCVGSMGKKGKRCAMAFQTGEKITIEYLNRFLPQDLRIKPIYKSKLTLADAKERYPDWYRRRIEEGKPRGHWTRHPGIYYNWIDKILQGAVVGRRYKCLENLCSLAVQCNIDPEQVEADCWMVAKRFDLLTEKEDNHFTSYDVMCALRTYHYQDESAYRRRREYVANSTGIPLNENPRNGRKQREHLHAENWMSEKGRPTTNVCKENRELALKFMRENGEIKGRPVGSGMAKEKVAAYRAGHPEANVSEVARALQISRTTVYKWWGVPLPVDPKLFEDEHVLQVSRTKHDTMAFGLDKAPAWVVRAVEARSDYTLLITFSRGEKKLYNARALLEKEIYSDLKDIDFFMKAKVEYGTVIWNDTVDLDPECLYEMSVPVEFEK